MYSFIAVDGDHDFVLMMLSIVEDGLKLRKIINLNIIIIRRLGRRAVVALNVAYVVLLVDKGVCAFRTVEASMAIRAWTLVLPQVGLHVVHLRKALIAHWTGEGFVSSMGTRMALEMSLGSGLEAAHLAFQPLCLVVVDHLVLVEGHLVDESFRADVALIRRLAGVPGHVVFQTELTTETFRAHGAGELFDRLVVLQMSNKSGIGLKRLPALITDIAGKVFAFCMSIISTPASELFWTAGALDIYRVLARAIRIVILVIDIAVTVRYNVFYCAVYLIVEVAHSVLLEKVLLFNVLLLRLIQLSFLLFHLFVYNDLVIYI